MLSLIGNFWHIDNESLTYLKEKHYFTFKTYLVYAFKFKNGSLSVDKKNLTVREHIKNVQENQ